MILSHLAVSHIALTTMPHDLFPFSPSSSRTAFNPRRWRSFLRSNGTLKIGFFSTTLILSGLIVYLTFFCPDHLSRRLPDWQLPSRLLPDSQTLPDHSESHFVEPTLPTFLPNPTHGSTIPNDPPPPSPPSSAMSDVLTLEQIRDIVAPTRGFFSRDYSLGLGWNNVG